MYTGLNLAQNGRQLVCFRDYGNETAGLIKDREFHK
jgi:hypothetical protein